MTARNKEPSRTIRSRQLPAVGKPGSTRSVATWASALMVIGGCMVGPDYVRPDAPVAETWLDVKSPPDAARDQPAAWWKSFEDPVLDALVDQAIAQNLTLREAGLRVIESRARRGIAVGQFFPQSQTLNAQASANNVSRNAPAGIGDPSYHDYSIGAAAIWELDFWGKFRRGIEAADAALEASVADYDAVLVMLVADVASDYVTIRSLEEQIALTAGNVRTQQDTFELTRVRFNAGAVSELDVATAQASLSNTQSLIPDLSDQLRRTKLALSVLLGRTPSDLESELQGARPVPTPPPEIAVGVPADLLRRRPDVRRAERAAAALCAEIGVATADLYPSISISGSTGFHTSTFDSARRSPALKNLFDSGSFMGFLGLDVSWPILNYGRIENNIRASDARFQQAIVAYRNVVLEAAADVESGLSTFLRSREQAALLAESVVASQRRVELSLIQYRQGAVDFLRVNQAQVDLVDRQNDHVIARARIAQSAIATYRALGGGWEIRAGSEFVPKETIDEMRARTDWGDILAPDYDAGSDFQFERPNPETRPSVGSRPHGP